MALSGKCVESAHIIIPGLWDRTWHWAPCSPSAGCSPCLCSLFLSLARQGRVLLFEASIGRSSAVRPPRHIWDTWSQRSTELKVLEPWKMPEHHWAVRLNHMVSSLHTIIFVVNYVLVKKPQFTLRGILRRIVVIVIRTFDIKDMVTSSI